MREKEKLKIGILVDQLVPGGVQKSAIEEARNLKAIGHEVTLFVLVRLHYDYQYQDLSRGLKVIFLSDYNPWLFRRAIRIPYFAFLTHLHLLNPLFSHRYTILKQLDFIVSHGTTTCITAQAISRKLKIPYLAFIWDPMIFIWEKVYSRRLRLLSPFIKLVIHHYEYSFLLSAALVATSSKVHQQFIKNVYHVEPITIHPGCLPPRALPKKSGQFILGYSRWELAKKPKLFLWLARRLPKARFLLAGSWTNSQEKKRFINQIKRNHLEKRVKLLFPVTNKDLKKLAASSLVWVHPNFEAFGMAGLEMAALGLPIIIPKGSGVTELFQEGKHGFFPAREGKQAFFDCLRFLLEHPQKTAQMGKEAAKAARLYTWRKHTKAVLKHIQNYHQQKKIVCLANAFVTTKATGGGDQFLIELDRRLPQNVHLTIVLPSIGFYHHQKAGVENPNIRFLVLAPNRFDNQDRPLPLFLAYLMRSFQTYFLLPKLPPFQALCTATDLIPDVIPAYCFHRARPGIPWVSRFFHFIEPPLKREGRLLVNTGSYLLQQISLKLLTQTDLVMIDNPNLKMDLARKGVNPSRIELHPGGVDTKGIAQVKPHPNYRSSALFIGRFQPHKGIFDAVSVWEKVVKEKPTARLTMIGYGPAEITKRLNHEVRKANLKKNIYFTGYIYERRELATYCRSSKLLLFLDHEAGFGLVIAEAMAAGLPVVAYNLPIFGAAYKKGFLVSSLKDTPAVARQVIDLLTHPEKRGILSREAREEAQKFDWSLAAHKFYRSLRLLGVSSSSPGK